MHWGARSLILAMVVAAVGATPPATHAETQRLIEADEQLQARVARLIEQLADDNYHRRVNARWELEHIGLAAFEQLREAAYNHPNPQIERAARYLIESQNVVWWLETDSIEVRELLRSYNAQPDVDRDTLLQRLADFGSDDALLALVRLARFESNELLSKSAALHLMESVRSKGESIDPALPKSLLLTTGEGMRPATQWLEAFLGEFAAHDEAVDLSGWKRLLAEEHARLSPHETASEDDGPDALLLSGNLHQNRQVTITLRLYQWLAGWITERVGRAEALRLVQPSLKLIGDNPLAIRSAAEWALDSKLPELVPALAARVPDAFDEEPQLGYLLAESYLRVGNAAEAEAAADRASQSVSKQLEAFQNLRNLNLDEIRANRHFILAQQLESRGLYRWAESEYLASLEFDVREGTQYRIRENLAQFYWFGKQHQQAADILEPLVQEILESPDNGLPNAPGDYTDPALTLSNYNFYLGLAQIEEGELQAAFESLTKALTADPVFANPDVVIAMYRISQQGIGEDRFRNHFESMVEDFRVRVVEAEEQMARSTNRIERVNSGPYLATACNQLAWLLSNCRSHPSEAIQLSLRSLELVPEEPAYLDTLARCYFAAGQWNQAVRVQRRAVELAPFERQMREQLKEFEAAAAAERARATESR